VFAGVVAGAEEGGGKELVREGVAEKEGQLAQGTGGREAVAGFAKAAGTLVCVDNAFTDVVDSSGGKEGGIESAADVTAGEIERSADVWGAGGGAAEDAVIEPAACAFGLADEWCFLCLFFSFSFSGFFCDSLVRLSASPREEEEAGLSRLCFLFLEAAR
jgi:hypothetical protein